MADDRLEVTHLLGKKLDKPIVITWGSKTELGGLTMNKCGDCVFLEKDDGSPYCVTLPLYTERDPDDAACEYFVDGRADDGKEVRFM
jgi:hypothetical protein